MVQVSASEFSKHVGEYLTAAAAGVRVEILDGYRSRVRAVLLAPEPASPGVSADA